MYCLSCTTSDRIVKAPVRTTHPGHKHVFTPNATKFCFAKQDTQFEPIRGCFYFKYTALRVKLANKR